MKRAILFMSVLSVFSITIIGCSKDDDTKSGITSTPITQLSQDEIDGLRFMREEEKLARDVYSYFIDLYGEQIFVNITSSEQTHMDTVLSLLIKYSIDDPAKSSLGEFGDTTLQGLYADLTSQGSVSVAEAYRVGATIEDLDIHDLNYHISKTNKSDILNVYNFLNCGSRNHLRSFDMKLESAGGSYTAQFLTQQEYDDIANSAKEKCGKH